MKKSKNGFDVMTYLLKLRYYYNREGVNIKSVKLSENDLRALHKTVNDQFVHFGDVWGLSWPLFLEQVKSCNDRIFMLGIHLRLLNE